MRLMISDSFRGMVIKKASCPFFLSNQKNLTEYLSWFSIIFVNWQSKRTFVIVNAHCSQKERAFTFTIVIFNNFPKKSEKKFDKPIIWQYIIKTMLRGRAVVAYQAHNLKVSGSIPLPATNEIQELTIRKFLFFTLTLEELQLFKRRMRCGFLLPPEPIPGSSQLKID